MEALAKPRVAVRLLGAYSRFASREALACAAIFFLTIGLRFSLRPWLPVPNPTIHDEFSYLLAADTYAHGRLANPTPPFWQHFETFHELQQPTYASKYPVLQGLALAVGQKLFGEPWIGVVLTSALMCASVCWMLQSWISAEWAFLGAFLFAFRVGVLSYWMNSFEGGAVPAIGGALVLGAVGRIWARREYFHSITGALGLAILMHSRPYDAVVLGLVSAIALVWLLRGTGVSLRSALTRAVLTRTVLIRMVLPAMGVLALSLAAVGYIDVRVTGHALTLPYQVHERQYAVAPMFLFLPLAPEPVYRHAVMHDFYTGWPVDIWRESRKDAVVQFFGRISIVLSFFFGAWPVMLPLLLWPASSVAERVSLALVACSILSIAPITGVVPHYAAAFAGVFYLRFLQGLSRLSARLGSAGIAMAAAAVALFLLSGRDSFSEVLAGRSANFGEARAEMARNLAAMPGKQLVLVRYAPGHNLQNEWVFNSAGIPGSKVVWAREMGPEQDRPFLDYFHDRQVWLAEVDRKPPLLTPYTATEPDSQKEARR